MIVLRKDWYSLGINPNSKRVIQMDEILAMDDLVLNTSHSMSTIVLVEAMRSYKECKIEYDL